MSSWIDLANYGGASGGLVAVLLGLVLSLAVRDLPAWDRRFFTVFFSLLTAYILSDLVSQFSLAFPRAFGPGVTQAAVFLESFFSGALMPALTVVLLHQAGCPWRRDPFFLATAGLFALYLGLLVFTQFTTVIYYISPENVYFRGPWYPVLLAPPALLMLVNLLLLARKWNVLSPRQRVAFLVYLAVPLVCMLAQMVSYGLLFIVLGTSVSALFLFLSLLLDQVRRSLRQARENARQRASIMVLQMRPHFIYNTMTSIYYLCRQDPEKAQQVTLDFSAYLRRNFTALAKEDTIPFTEELEHTRAYLAVEQVRFEGRLFVTLDTPHTRFRLPPLTLQPIVENAVKHGVDPELEPLTLSVTTRETPASSEILVEDNGPGPDPDGNDDPHIALENIRERLALMCGGTLTLLPREGGGTAVRLVIPSQKQ